MIAHMIYVYFALAFLTSGEACRVLDSERLTLHLGGKPRRFWLVTLDCVLMFVWSLGFLIAGIVEGVS